MLLSEFYPLVAALTDPQQRRWSAGAAYLLSEAMRNGEPAAAAEARILTVPQYANGLAAAGLTANFNSIVAANPFVNDSMTGADTTLLTAHVGEVGATWTKHPVFGDNLTLAGNAAIGTGAANFALHYASGVPPSADYTVTGAIIVRSVTGFAAVFARCDPTADTNYGVFLTTTALQIIKKVAAVSTTLASYTLAGGDVLAPAQNRTIAIQIAGSSMFALMDGVQKVSATDAAVAAAGRVAIRCRDSTLTTGMAVDSVTAT